jgi:hypothetical protein
MFLKIRYLKEIIFNGSSQEKYLLSIITPVLWMPVAGLNTIVNL